MRSRLKRFNGPGLFPQPLSTSNLRAPDQAAVLGYLAKGLATPASQPQPLFAELAERLARYHQAEHCVLFSTGFWALVAAIRLRALPGRSHVIIPSFTYRRLADVVYWAGLIPVFVDVNPDLAVSPRAIEGNLSQETALILAVHPIVNCCDVTAILALSSAHGVPVVFDAVESAHETFAGRRIGSFGVGEVFSLHASKLLNGLEGGYVCTNDAAFARALELYKTGASVSYGGANHRGLNGLPNLGHAAFALASLDDLADNVAHNRAIYQCYQRRLAGQRGVRLLEFDESQQTSYKNIVVEVQDDYPLSRDALCAAMNAEAMLARKHYHPPLHRKRFTYPVIIREMSHTEFAENRYLNLPCGARVAESDVHTICDFITFAAENPGAFEAVPL